MTEKEQWLNDNIELIKSKGLKSPIRLNACTVITDLDKYLRILQASILKTEKTKVLKTLVHKIEELTEL